MSNSPAQSDIEGSRDVIDKVIEGLDPLILEAAKEVDQTLLDWYLSLSPRERLRACTKATEALARFRDEPSSSR